MIFTATFTGNQNKVMENIDTMHIFYPKYATKWTE